MSYISYLFFQVNEIVPEEKCSLIPKQMCHSVTSKEEETPPGSRRKRLFVRSAGSDPWAFLRRHYLTRHRQRMQQIQRKSRTSFGDVVDQAVEAAAASEVKEVSVTPPTPTTSTTSTTTTPSTPSTSSTTSRPAEVKRMKMVCKMVPEQKCVKKRVNPQKVMKNMRRRECRQPRKNSLRDKWLVEQLTSGSSGGP